MKKIIEMDKCPDTGKKPDPRICLSCASYVESEASCLADDWRAETINDVLYRRAKDIVDSKPALKKKLLAATIEPVDALADCGEFE